MNNFLLTAKPGEGKSTFLLSFKEKIEKSRLTGVTVKELRDEEGNRCGFEMNFISSNETIKLATKGIEKADVGKYTIEQTGIEKLKEFLIYLMDDETKIDIVIFDEIGKMQYEKFPEFTYYLDILLKKKKVLLLGTIVEDNVEWAKKYKTGELAQLIEFTRERSDEIMDFLLKKL